LKLTDAAPDIGLDARPDDKRLYVEPIFMDSFCGHHLHSNCLMLIKRRPVFEPPGARLFRSRHPVIALQARAYARRSDSARLRLRKLCPYRRFGLPFSSDGTPNNCFASVFAILEFPFLVASLTVTAYT
jgi:hypothetical protein